MSTRSAAVLGSLILLSAIAHAAIDRYKPGPRYEGRIASDVAVREGSGVSQLKCGGCRVALYDNFVLIYVDKQKQPTWTDNYVLSIPWSKIENLTLKSE